MMCYIRVQNGLIAQNIFVFWKIIISIIVIYLLAHFIVQIFSKFLAADPKLWGLPNFEPKMTHLPKWNFYQ